jgi:hypothetical protein
MDDIEILNKQLPPGIKAVPTVHGVRFTVRTSFKGKKESLGTFTSQDAAIRALVEYKIKKSYTTAANNVADIVTHTMASMHARKQQAVQEEKRKTPLASQIEALHEYLTTVGSAAIGDGVTPITITNADDTITQICSEAVSAVFFEMFGMMPEGASKKAKKSMSQAGMLDGGNDDDRFASFFGSSNEEASDF